MKIITNNKPRHLKCGFELPEKVRADFDYLSDEDYASNDFVFYKGDYYDLNEFMLVKNNPKLKGWHGYRSDSFFSGILVKIIDSDTVILGQYFS